MKNLIAGFVFICLSHSLVAKSEKMFNYVCSANLATQNITCNGLCNGSANVTATGIAPFTYVWSSGGNSDTAMNLCPGNYNVTISDANGCSVSHPFTIFEPPAMAFIHTPRSPCFGFCDGEVTVLTTGGTPPYGYHWDNGSTINTMFGCAGDYPLCVTDSNSCTLCDTIVIPFLSELVVNPVITDASCGTCADGSIALDASGSLPPYTYSWVGGNTTSTLSNLNPGYYYGCVIDSNFCRVCDSISVGNITSVKNIPDDVEISFSSPVHDKIVIHFSSSVRENHLTITDVSGRKIFQKNNISSSESIDCAPLSPGVYFLSFYYEDKFLRRKIIIE